MKTVSKKLLSLLLVVLLLAAAVPFQAFAEAVNYTVRVTVCAAEEGHAVLGTVDIPVSTEAPATKSAIDAAIAGKIEGRTITSYTYAGGSLPLSNPEDKVEAPEGALVDGVYSITVYAQSNTPPAPADFITLTLDAGEGATVGTSGSSTAITIEKNADGKYLVPTLPTASKSGYTFLGWFVGADQLENGDELTANTTATASYQLNTKNIKLKGVKTTESLETAWLISEYNATPDQNLLEFLRTNASAAAQSNVPAGYQMKTSGGSILWYNYNGSQALTGQEQVTNAPQEVLVKYEPKTFTLYFRVDGGSVDPTSKSVTFDSKVGTLPTPKKSGEVFMGWFDANGEQYTSETVYKVNGDTTLTARWQSESSVLLRIYLSPNTTTPDRIVDITGKVVGNGVGRTEVEAIVTKYYTGSKMKLIGLFSDATWAGYKAGTVTEGTPNVIVQEDSKTTNVHVVVTNATNKPNSSTGSTSSGSSSSGSGSSSSTTKPADSDNPKTGDSMMVYVAPAVMIVAAVALIVIQLLRKKKVF